MRARLRICRPASAASLLALVLLAGACSGPQYEYVRNTSLRTAFKVPTDWSTFDEAAMLNLGSGPQPDTPDPIQWLVGIDGDPHPSVDHVLDPNDLNTDHPQGLALVQSFSFQDRDSSSFSAMRNVMFPVDAMLNGFPNDVGVVSYDDHLVRDDARGIHLVIQFRSNVLREAQQAASQSEGQGTNTDAPSSLERSALGGSGAALLNPDWVTANQVTFVDPNTERMYLFTIVCSASCYERNRSDIESAVDSWTVIS